MPTDNDEGYIRTRNMWSNAAIEQAWRDYRRTAQRATEINHTIQYLYDSLSSNDSIPPHGYSFTNVNIGDVFVTCSDPSYMRVSFDNHLHVYNYKKHIQQIIPSGSMIKVLI